MQKLYLEVETDSNRKEEMEQIINSPCTNECFVPPGTDLCMGCFRTIKEIMVWIKLTDEQKNELLNKIEIRKNAYGKIK
jgi:hypothetical protein